MKGCISKYLNPILMQSTSCWLNRQKVLKTASRPFSSKKHQFSSERLNFFTKHCAPPRSSRTHLKIISWFFLEALTFFTYLNTRVYCVYLLLFNFFTYLNIWALWSFHRSLWSNRRLRRRVCWSWRSVELRQFHSLGSQRSPPQGSQRKLLFLFLRRIVSSL